MKKFYRNEITRNLNKISYNLLFEDLDGKLHVKIVDYTHCIFDAYNQYRKKLP